MNSSTTIHRLLMSWSLTAALVLTTFSSYLVDEATAFVAHTPPSSLLSSISSSSSYSTNVGSTTHNRQIHQQRQHRRRFPSTTTTSTTTTTTSIFAGTVGTVNSTTTSTYSNNNNNNNININNIQPGEVVESGILENSMSNVEIIPDFCPKDRQDSSRNINKVINSYNGQNFVDEEYQFVNMLRGSANYIATHRGNTVVLHIPATLFDIHHSDSTVYKSTGARESKKLLDDIALLWMLGIKIVIVIGVRGIVEERLKKEYGSGATYDDDVVIHKGIRVTDESRLRAIEEAAGYARFEIECQLGRALKGKCQLRSTVGANVISGNFYSAKPIGVREGVDYKWTGLLRRVEVEKINQAHKNDDVVIMTSLGVSPSGELFCVNSESLAAGVAKKLSADKIIYMLEEPAHIRDSLTKNEIMIIRLSEAKRLLKNFGVHVDSVGGERVVQDSNDPCNPFYYNQQTSSSSAVKEFLEKIGFSSNALTNGVKRAHLVCPSDGSLLEELFTRDDGTGTMISRDLYDGIREATVKDVDGIVELIQPLIDAGMLVNRPQTLLEKEIDTFYVYTRDDLVVACGQLKLFEDGYAEIGCLAVKSDYQRSGKGDAMLTFLERIGVKQGAELMFVLSTQTMQWFIERGFDKVSVKDLPPSRQETYNYERKSKIYMKRIDGTKDLDQEELMWDNGDVV